MIESEVDFNSDKHKIERASGFLLYLHLKKENVFMSFLISLSTIVY